MIARYARSLGQRWHTLRELWQFMRGGGRWWLLPFVVVLLATTVLLLGVYAFEYVAPFVYTIF